MSEENVEIVRRMYEAFHGGDAEGALSYFDPEVTVDASVRLDGGIGHGRDELSTIITKWVGTWNEWREEIEEMRGIGNKVVVVATQYGSGKGSGIDVEARYGLVFAVRSAKISSMKLYATPAEALEAGGLAE